MRRDIARPRAGAPFAALALLAVCALLVSPLAASGHHHDEGTTPHDDAPCSVCLWQSHQVADLVDVPRTAAPAFTPLGAAADTRHVSAVERPGVSARAPPVASV